MNRQYTHCYEGCIAPLAANINQTDAARGLLLENGADVNLRLNMLKQIVPYANVDK